MGLALGVTLGLIAFFRGAFTPDDTRSGPRKVNEPFVARTPPGQSFDRDEKGDFRMPAGARLTRSLDRGQRVRLPEGATLPPPKPDGDYLVYEFPGGCEVRTDPVDRWLLGQVIALSVMGICMWGTVVGALLPLGFRKFGVDPGLASSPFVATFVDVTGIVIFFSIASFSLL
jgi:magnesium transporter